MLPLHHPASNINYQSLKVYIMMPGILFEKKSLKIVNKYQIVNVKCDKINIQIYSRKYQTISNCEQYAVIPYH